jgi:NAD-reducing hydrogenase small subunit
MDMSGELLARPRLATVWLGGCSGSHISSLDLDEFVTELAQQVDLVSSPLIDTKEYPEEVAPCLIEGAVAKTAERQVSQKLRRHYLPLGTATSSGAYTTTRFRRSPRKAP